MKFHAARRFAPFLLVLTATISNAAASAVNQAEEKPQHATIEDMRIFDPYIGKFRSATQMFDDSDIEYYFTINYAWFDAAKTTLKFTVAMEIPAQDRTVTSSEGFYAYDPFNQRIFVFGAFKNRPSGWGALGEFDHETGARTVWAKSMGADGVVTNVRDRFELIDENTWKNKTSIRLSGDAEWKIVHEGVYTRVGE